MFGKKMMIECKDGIVQLKPFQMEEIANAKVIEMMADAEVTQYLTMVNSPTIEDKEDWWKKTRKEKNTIVWGIYLNDSELLGVTSLEITSPNHSAESGFLIFNKKYWKKGIASRSHIARTFYATHFLNLKTIISGVFSPNIGSFKALQSVGYFVTGYRLGSHYINGKFKNIINLQWVNPKYADLVLEDGIPKDIVLDSALNLAKRTLEIGENEVVF
jgi:[ribosomal protein S5]-alanine N-acetyltransferase